VLCAYRGQDGVVVVRGGVLPKHFVKNTRVPVYRTTQ